MPELDKQDSHEPTNTYALLVPHPALFSTEILELLHGFYGKFGTILHWAPVKGLGRIIIVWDRVEAGRLARQVGGGSLTIGTHESVAGGELLDSSRTTITSHTSTLTLRLFPLPSTSKAVLTNLSQANSANASSYDPENPDPNRLAPPAHPRNFLVSPPGSPPEGWEPILEDAPNDQTLASDLIKALDSLQVDPVANGIHRTRWIGSDEDDVAPQSREPVADVILETSSGFTVAVQAPEVSESQMAEPVEQVEYLFDHPGPNRSIVKGISGERATVDSMQGRYESSAGWRTPGLGERTFSGRPTPTARPPHP